MHLGSQFPGRSQHQRTDLAWGTLVVGGTLAVGEQQLQDGQRETGGLAGAGLGGDHQVAAFQYGRDGLGLDGSRSGITSGSHGAHQRVGQAERGKGHSDKPCDGRLRTRTVRAAENEEAGV